MEDKKIPIVAVVGPTASGKTALGVMLCRMLDGEVVSADSMQLYRGMDIATAKPTAQEMQGIPHHLIGMLDPNQPFSVADYVRLANEAVDHIRARGKFPVLVGGTGQYVDALLSGLCFSEQKADPAVRADLQRQLEREGASAMLERLRGVDPAYAVTLHPNNTKRVLRALELWQITGKTMSEQNRESRRLPSRYHSVKIGLMFANRQQLYDRIDDRVDEMVQRGLVEEARQVLYNPNCGPTARQAIGYKELAPYFSGEQDLQTALDYLKQQTRRYAKRQLTWFRRDPSIHWFDPDRLQLQTICEQVQIILENEGAM